MRPISKDGWPNQYWATAITYCPGGVHVTYGTCRCPAGKTWVLSKNQCIPYVDRDHDKPQSCEPRYGNPIYPLTGSKRNEIELDRWLGEPLKLAFDTRRMVPSNDAALTFDLAALPSFGPLWTSSAHKKLVFQSGSKPAIQASRGAGRWVSFVSAGSGNYAPDTDITDRISAVSGGWRYFDAVRGAYETYNSTGQLLNVKTASGAVHTYTYSDSATPATIAPAAGLLLSIQDQQGRTISFTYEKPPEASLPIRIKQLIDPAQQTTEFAYDSHGNLQRITWPDQKQQQFLYENTTHPWALTGILDEHNARTVTYGYDTEGRAISTEAAGGADKFSVTWGTAPRWQVSETYDEQAGVIWRDHRWLQPQGTQVTLPNGQTVDLQVASVQGTSRLTSQSQPAGAGCAASTRTTEYDTLGNAVRRDDFTGKRVCFAHDLSRNLETTRVEGLSASATCSAFMVPGATLPTGSRKVSTQWHPEWRLETKVAEPGRITTTIYNGQPDPFSGGAVASCAPSSALLPDGKPIAVVCKRVEQATTDANGSQGFSASLAAGVPARTWSYTYNQYGQVLTEDGPRTDVADVTTYEYYPDTTSEWTRGDLKQVTNAAGQVTRYTRYNPHGQVLQSVDANGVITDSTYDLRQRLTSVTVAGQTTTYAYEPTGLLKRVTQPDASYVEYHYDDAHRLTGLSDQAGNTITYTLDNAGNRTVEQVTDPEGVLARNLSRAFDALGRVQQSTGSIQKR
ncbi:RHS repeat protein [Schlegelella sp. S2-27]|uniref:RHS repeat protein n=1 Tax=Caldimonas mangrovi TaxID=2944811 RepID=A0ABT0YS50_9BURK|nr:RHS repeat protein [Caldimonas mangrovi]MCM5681570.1 RHS repeat protein [Caldimonas mangrovi]